MTSLAVFCSILWLLAACSQSTKVQKTGKEASPQSNYMPGKKSIFVPKSPAVIGNGQLRKTSKQYANNNKIKHQEQVKSTLIHQLQTNVNKMYEEVHTLNQMIEQSVKSTENMDVKPLLKSRAFDLHRQNITNAVKEIIRDKYNRRRLAILKDEKLARPKDPPYQFRSLDGEFLKKSQKLYSKLYASNPFHEQGIMARECGLTALEATDQYTGKNQGIKARVAYHTAEAMEWIVAGKVFLEDERQYIYEFCVGKSLLNGEKIENKLSLIPDIANYLTTSKLTVEIQIAKEVLSVISEKTEAKTEAKTKLNINQNKEALSE